MELRPVCVILAGSMFVLLFLSEKGYSSSGLIIMFKQLFVGFQNHRVKVTSRDQNSIFQDKSKLARLTMRYFFKVKDSVARSKTTGSSILNPLPEFKNPCWYEEFSEKSPVDNRYFYKDYKLRKSEALTNLSQIYDVMKSRGMTSRMRCLPGVYIGGVYKGGTTDLFAAMTSHPMVVAPVIKEPLWGLWGAGKLTPATFEDYLGLYDVTAETIRSKTNGTAPNPYITLDATAPLLHLYNYYRDLPWNKNLSEPVITIPHHLKLLNPTAKVIFLLREPTSWIVSCHNYFRHVYGIISSDDLHRKVQGDIDAFRKCFSGGSSVRACVYKRKDWCNILNVVYVVFLRDWISNYGSTGLLIIKSEDYFTNKALILQKILRFLHLPEFTEEEIKKLESVKVANSSRKRVHLLTETKILIQGFMSEWNKLLEIKLREAGIDWKTWT